MISADISSQVRVVGRDAELAALRTAFTAGAAGRPVLRALTGMGGVGKTSLARAYAQQHERHYDLIWWVHGEDPAAIDGQFRRLLEILAPRDARHVSDAVAAVHGLLAARPGPWLLIIDNLPAPVDLGRVLPAAGDGHVLVTTRATAWADHTTPMPITPLQPAAAAELLLSLSGDTDQTAAAGLASLLDGLPLALAQAGAYCGQTRMRLVDYLELYREQRADLHSTGTAPNYDETIATTLQLAVDRLSPDARNLLTLLSFYAPDAIPMGVLLSPADPSTIELPGPAEGLRHLIVAPLARHTVKGELFAYSVVTAATDTALVSVHRLVQAVIHDRFPDPAERQPWGTAAKALLDAAWPALPATATTIARWHTLHTHVLAVIDHLPPEHPDTLAARRNLAGWTGEAGDAAAARDLYAELLSDSERVLGAEHPHTLVSRGNVAHWTGEAGDAAAARDLYAELLLVRQRVLGPEHPKTVLTRGNVAHWTSQST